MWTRGLLKQNAWNSLKPYYWTAFGVTIMTVIAAYIPSLLQRIITFTFSMGSGGDLQRFMEMMEQMEDMSEAQKEAMLPEILATMMPAVEVASGISMMITLLTLAYRLFVMNPISCGVNKFYIKGREGMTDLGSFFANFTNGNYMPTVKVLFFRDLYIFLWSLLLVIPGIIKTYEYALVPYLIAENPNLPKERAFAISKATMEGEKWKLFVLELSFIGWWILGGICCYVGALFVVPYFQATLAEFYTCMKAKAFANGITSEQELNQEANTFTSFNGGNASGFGGQY